MPPTALGITYLTFLGYLFLGISVVADIFMEAIEHITSSTKQVQVQDKEGKVYTYEVPVWNATLANLTLMALGSSAPEILLAIIEALQNLGGKAGELGPSSIVGSGAFNLLVISGISILSVEEPKEIHDMGVFITTATSSVFAYGWMYFVLELNTKGVVDPLEAWATLVFFIILLVVAFLMDKWQQSKDKVSLSKAEIEEQNRMDELKIKKSHLRSIAKAHGEQTVISIARGVFDAKTESISPDEQKDIIDTFKQCLDLADLSKC